MIQQSHALPEVSLEDIVDHIHGQIADRDDDRYQTLLREFILALDVFINGRVKCHETEDNRVDPKGVSDLFHRAFEVHWELEPIWIPIEWHMPFHRAS